MTSLLAGLALGGASRLIDTAPWAPVWIGSVFAPWLAATWLAGATTSERRTGALRGTLMLAAVVAAYLLVAGTTSSWNEAARLAPGLAASAAVAGPIFGTAGAIRRAPWPGSLAGAAMLGGALVADSIVLNLGNRALWERAIFAAELLAGLWLAQKVARHPRAAPLALVIGFVLVSVELAVMAVLGLPLP